MVLLISWFYEHVVIVVDWLECTHHIHRHTLLHAASISNHCYLRPTITARACARAHVIRSYRYSLTVRIMAVKAHALIYAHNRQADLRVVQDRDR